MSKLMGRKVSSLRVHQTTLAEGYGNIGPVIKNDGKKKGDISMEIVEGGVLVNAGLAEIFIPQGNIVSAQLIKEK